jgi:hypothetical protein
MPSAMYAQLGTYEVTTSGVSIVTISLNTAYMNYIFVANCQTATSTSAMYGWLNGNSSSGQWTRLECYAGSSSTPAVGTTNSGQSVWVASTNSQVPDASTNSNVFGTYRIYTNNPHQVRTSMIADGISGASGSAVPNYSWCRSTWTATAGNRSSVSFATSDTWSIGSRFSVYGMG